MAQLLGQRQLLAVAALAGRDLLALQFRPRGDGLVSLVLQGGA